MTITSLNQLLKAFKDFADNHDQLNSFGYGRTTEINTSIHQDYPLLWATQSGPNGIQNTNGILMPIYNLTFIIADLINDQPNVNLANGANKNNTQEIISDAHLLAMDLAIFSKTLKSKDVSLVEEPIDINVTFEDIKDKVAGVSLVLSYVLENARCTFPNKLIDL